MCLYVKKLENFIKITFSDGFFIFWSQKNQAWHFVGVSEIIVMAAITESGSRGPHTSKIKLVQTCFANLSKRSISLLEWVTQFQLHCFARFCNKIIISSEEPVF